MPDVKPKPPTGKGGGIMSKKIGPIPLPIAIGLVAVVGYLLYRRAKSSTASGTSGTSSASGSSAVDPNAIDPNTGLTYGAEEQAAQAGLGAGASTNGSGSGGAGGGLSVGDLEGLIQSLQGLGATNYYYGGGGSGAAPTPTNTTGPGAGTTNQYVPSPSPAVPNSLSAYTPPPPTSPVVQSAVSSVAKSAIPTGGSAGPDVVNGQDVIANSAGLAITGTNQFGGAIPTVAPYTSLPATQTSPYTTGGTANKSGYSANVKQGVFSVH